MKHWIWLVMLLTANCATTTDTVHVSSRPSGARILIDGKDSGLTTPSTVTLAASEKQYKITIDKSGYNSAHRLVKLESETEVMSPKEAAGRILCAPCCLGLTLPGCLTPVSVERGFVPDSIVAVLDVAGQGLRMEIDPPDAEVYADGRLSRLLDGKYLILEPGDHEIEVREEGYRPYVRVVRVDEKIYQDFNVQLQIEGQGILLSVDPEGARVYLDDQYQGVVSEDEVRYHTEPGAHSLRVELDGHRTFEDIITVAAEQWRTVEMQLPLAGQGVLFRKPRGLRKDQQDIQILVDDQLVATNFDEPLRLEPGTVVLVIRVPGHEEWRSSVLIKEDRYIEIGPELKRARK